MDNELLPLDRAAETTGVKFRTLQYWVQKKYLPWYPGEGRERWVAPSDIKELVAAAAGGLVTPRVAEKVKEARAERQRKQFLGSQQFVEQTMDARLTYLDMLKAAIVTAELEVRDIGRHISALESRLALWREHLEQAADFLEDRRRELDEQEEITVDMSTEYRDLLLADDARLAKVNDLRQRVFEQRRVRKHDEAVAASRAKRGATKMDEHAD